MNTVTRPLAVVTGASTGIGLELARQCARHNFDLIIAADEPEIEDAAAELAAESVKVTAIQADLATAEGVERLWSAIEDCGRPVDALLANAGRGLGHGFLDQEFHEVVDVVETNIIGTLRLTHLVGRRCATEARGAFSSQVPSPA